MKGYTAKVGLLKPDVDLTCADCWVRNETCTHPELAQSEIEARRRHKAHGNQPDSLCPCNWPGEPGARKVPPAPKRMAANRARRLPVQPREAATMPLDGCWVCYDWTKPCDDCRESDDSALEALADRMEAKRSRTSVRRLNEQALAREAYDAACPHCACYMHAECCYCDGGQVHK